MVAQEARGSGRNLYEEIRVGKWDVVVVAPDKLNSPEVEGIFRDDPFRANVVVLGIDDVHDLDPSGRGFRAAYRRIAAVPKRLDRRTSLVAVSSTLSDGGDYKIICERLSLQDGGFYCLRLSNEQPNIRTIFHILTHSLTGLEFPDVRWLISPGTKAVVYCDSIDLSFRVANYLWKQLPPGERRMERVRLWTSLATDSGQATTVKLFEEDPETTAIIALNVVRHVLKVRNVKDIVYLGVPETMHSLVAEEATPVTGQGMASEVKMRTYIEPSVLAAAKAARPPDIPPSTPAQNTAQRPAKGLSSSAAHGAEHGKKTAPDKVALSQPARGGASKGKTGGGKTKAAMTKEMGERLDKGILRMLLAHEDRRCLVAEGNRVYGNDKVEPGGAHAGLGCIAAERSYPCSSCAPLACLPPAPPLQFPPPQPSSGKMRQSRDAPRRLTKKMRDNASKYLEIFAFDHWYARSDLRTDNIHHGSYWTDEVLEKLLDNFHLMRDLTTLRDSLAEWEFVRDDAPALFALVNTLNATYDDRHEKTRVIAGKKRAKTLAKKKQASAAQKPCDIDENHCVSVRDPEVTAQAIRQGEPTPPVHSPLLMEGHAVRYVASTFCGDVVY
ncbi:hypothetical protein PsYK624_166980 [Phanerochaete sordida]|uniref:Helicase ATP-binding domain-containing protein n=1 Tax=Phanerochaete sordida TaxID=48140 RepID=A0A9P3GTH0_9APHY|nr:hypothetical protein PsYK624_166980 [Phanerochaete sordida]